MDHVRQIVTDSSQAFGKFQAAQSSVQQGLKLRKQLWLISTTPLGLEDATLTNQCRTDLENLARKNIHVAPHVETLLANLTTMQESRSHLKAIQQDLLHINQNARAAQTLLNQSALLKAKLQELVHSLPTLTQSLEAELTVTQKLATQLAANMVSAKEAENHLLLLFLFIFGYVACGIYLVLRQIIKPLKAVDKYARRLGTGVPMPKLPNSRILEINDLSATMENLAAYLGQATVASEKMATERTHFQRMSLFDGLTNLYNRRAFDTTLQQLWSKALAEHRPLGLVMLDVDKFKVYNDTCGHQAGDVCLRKVADALAKSVRGADVAARYGGEEFVVILPNADKNQAAIVAERIRKMVLDVKLPHPGSPTGPYVTVSLGVTAQVITNEITAQDLVRHADQALYHSKENGRNRVTIYEPGAQNTEA